LGIGKNMLHRAFPCDSTAFLL